MQTPRPEFAVISPPGHGPGGSDGRLGGERPHASGRRRITDRRVGREPAQFRARAGGAPARLGRRRRRRAGEAPRPHGHLDRARLADQDLRAVRRRLFQSRPHARRLEAAEPQGEFSTAHLADVLVRRRRLVYRRRGANPVDDRRRRRSRCCRSRPVRRTTASWSISSPTTATRPAATPSPWCGRCRGCRATAAPAQAEPCWSSKAAPHAPSNCSFASRA